MSSGPPWRCSTRVHEPSHQRHAALARGGRIDLDPARRGTGLGLAIASDIAAAYGGDIALGASDLGGLLVRVTLPKAA